MEISKQPRLYFKGVDILNVTFNAISRKENDSEVDIKCSPKVFFPASEVNKFKVIIDVDINSEDKFELTLRAVGHFELSEDINDELKKLFVNSNAAAMLFPYVRSFVSTLTSNLGGVIDQVTIPTQFFKGELDETSEEI